jgi:acetylornithine aminotransferase/acetylornithine/N-succinyldiaminopimelate aminotransferase
LTTVRTRSEPWHAALRQLVADFPARLTAFRGQGYLVGLQLSSDPAPTVAALREHGLLAPMAGGNVIRLLPPLTATADELAAAVKILREVFSAAA